jgi:uncharacterized protein YndB with AHSA1/START domain
MSQTRSLTFTRSVRAAPPEAFRAFIQPTLLRDWLCDSAAANPTPGGHIFLTWNLGYQVMGRYTRLESPSALTFTWLGTGDPGQTQVELAFEPDGEATRVTLTHSGLGESPAWDLQAARWNQEWPAALENLRSVLETGIDLRVANRPRLGIMMDRLTAEAANRLNLPATEGVLLHATAENSGAQAAGLQKDDVLVSLNGVPLLSPDSFQQALHGLKAGDTPPVEYYRGGEKHTVQLRLGNFPVPQFPESAAALAETVRALHVEELANMRAKFAGLSAQQAALRPREGEWSVREILAHLVLTERDYQAWVADMLNDEPVEDDLRMSPNVNPRVEALAARMPALDDLLNELAAALEETAAMIAALPERFIRDRKHLYRRAAGWAIEVTPTHYSQEHLGQIQAAIDTARGK